MAKRKPKIEVFKAKNGEFCWRCRGVNGKELFRASETYKRKGTMEKVLYKYLGHDGLLSPNSGYDNWVYVDLTEKR